MLTVVAQFQLSAYSIINSKTKNTNWLYSFMAALRSRCGHYIFVLWFLSSSFFYSSPNLD